MDDSAYSSIIEKVMWLTLPSVIVTLHELKLVRNHHPKWFARNWFDPVWTRRNWFKPDWMHQCRQAFSNQADPLHHAAFWSVVLVAVTPSLLTDHLWCIPTFHANTWPQMLNHNSFRAQLYGLLCSLMHTCYHDVHALYQCTCIYVCTYMYL